MKELVEVIAKALVENPDEVVVTESVKDDETVIELSVAPADMGKVIGKQGRIGSAISMRKLRKKRSFLIMSCMPERGRYLNSGRITEMRSFLCR